MELSEKIGPQNSDGPMHLWFELSYSAFLVLPRVMIQEMPTEWQERLVKLLDEATEMGVKTPDFQVYRKGGANPVPWMNYRHGNLRDCMNYEED